MTAAVWGGENGTVLGRERVLLNLEFLLRQGYQQTTFSDDEIDAYVRPDAALGGF